MFLAIFIPPMKKSKTVGIVVVLSALLSCGFTYIPYINKISSGFVIIICAIVAAGVGAIIHPIDDEKMEGA
ncbi:MAG: hypothetical protein RRZ68_02350 [Oscillospiraceae bacterium]